jgi:hypothetical protein
MVDCQVTWVSTRSRISSGKGMTGSRQETVLKNGSDSVKPVQPVVALDPEIGTKWISTTSGPRFKG